MRKISSTQFVAMLITCRLFVTMTYSPVGSENNLLAILAIALSSVVQSLMIIIPLLLYRITPQMNVVENGYCISKPLGYLYSLVYGLYTMWIGISVLVNFSLFMKLAFPVFHSEISIVISLAAVGLYAACLGIQPTGRSSVLVMILFVAMIVAVVLGASGKIKPNELHLATENLPKMFASDTFEEIGRNAELCAVAFLLPHLRKNQTAATYSYLAVKLVAVTFIVFLYTSILGNYAYTAKLPFYHLSSYSKTTVIERFGALFLILWTMAAVIKLALFIYISGTCLKFSFPAMSSVKAKLIVTVIATFTAMAFLTLNLWDVVQNMLFETISIIVLVGIIPLITLIIQFVRKEKKHEKKQA